MLAARRLSFAYPDRLVLQDFTVELGAGVIWLKGANGSGKSTLLKLLAGVMEPLSGSRHVVGIDAASQPQTYRRQVFWCGPDELPFDYLSTSEYLGFIAGLYPSFQDSAVASHLEALDLMAQLGKRIGRLSTGTKRKVWLVAAMACGTPVVLLDEPLNALDGSSAAYLSSYLAGEATRKRRCWLVASHEPLVTDTKDVFELALGPTSIAPRLLA
jgi:ABC-type multidrug transport system ATPase subunit